MNRSTLIVLVVGALVAAPALVASGAESDAVNHRATNPGWGSANEVYLAVNPTDPQNIVVVAKDYTLGRASPCSAYNVWMGIYVTHDGGATWTNSLAPGYPGGPVSNVLSAYRCTSDPIAVFATDGTLYLNGLSIGGADTAVWVARSTDGGNTVTDVQIVDTSPSLDKNMMTVDPLTGAVYVAYIDFAQGTRILVAAGRPGPNGLEWGAPVRTGGTGSSPMVNVLPTGQVFVAWINAAGGSQIRGTVCLPLLLQCNAPTTIVASLAGTYGIPNAAFRAYTLPTSAIDGMGRVTITWHARGPSGDTNVYATRSGALAQGPWSAPAKVNQDAGRADQVLPNVAVSKDGSRVAVVYYDRRDDPANKLITPYVSISADGGATWRDVRVGDVMFNGDGGIHQNGFSFIGDYLGIAAVDGGVHVAWADARDFPTPRTGSHVYEAFVAW